MSKGSQAPCGFAAEELGLPVALGLLNGISSPDELGFGCLNGKSTAGELGAGAVEAVRGAVAAGASFGGGSLPFNGFSDALALALLALADAGCTTASGALAAAASAGGNVAVGAAVTGAVGLSRFQRRAIAATTASEISDSPLASANAFNQTLSVQPSSSAWRLRFGLAGSLFCPGS